MIEALDWNGAEDDKRHTDNISLLLEGCRQDLTGRQKGSSRRTDGTLCELRQDALRSDGTVKD